MKNKYNQLEDILLDNLRKDIAIINFEKLSQKTHTKFIIYFKKIIITILSLLGFGGITVFAYVNLYLTPIDNLNISYALIKDAVDNGYVENMDMSYIYSNDIGVKINSLVMSDDKLDIVFDFDFNKNILPQNKPNIAMIIYDECKNIYYIWNTPNNTIKNKLYLKNYYKRFDLSNDNYINGSQSMITLYQSNNKYIGELSLCALEKYPKAKQLYINIYDIGYNENSNDKYKSLFNNVNWSFEIDIPEQFYNRNSLNYDLKEVNTSIDFILEEFNITETGTTLIYKTTNNIPLQISIIDGNNKIYKSNGTILLNKNNNSYNFKNEYNSLNKYVLTDKLYLYIENFDITIEVEKSDKS